MWVLGSIVQSNLFLNQQKQNWPINFSFPQLPQSEVIMLSAYEKVCGCEGSFQGQSDCAAGKWALNGIQMNRIMKLWALSKYERVCRCEGSFQGQSGRAVGKWVLEERDSKWMELWNFGPMKGTTSGQPCRLHEVMKHIQTGSLQVCLFAENKFL